MNIKGPVLIISAILTAVVGLVLSTWVEPFNTAHVSSFSMTLTVQGETMLYPLRHLGSILVLLASVLFTVGFISTYFQTHVPTEKPRIRELEIHVIPQGETPLPTT